MFNGRLKLPSGVSLLKLGMISTSTLIVPMRL